MIIQRRKIRKIADNLDNWLDTQAREFQLPATTISEYLGDYLTSNGISLDINVKKKNQRGAFIETKFIPRKKKNEFSSLFDLK